jgi:hypothetical protein
MQSILQCSCIFTWISTNSFTGWIFSLRAFSLSSSPDRLKHLPVHRFLYNKKWSFLSSCWFETDNGTDRWLLVETDIGTDRWLLVETDIGTDRWLLVETDIGTDRWLLVETDIGTDCWLRQTLALTADCWLRQTLALTADCWLRQTLALTADCWLRQTLALSADWDRHCSTAYSLRQTLALTADCNRHCHRHLGGTEWARLLLYITESVRKVTCKPQWVPPWPCRNSDTRQFLLVRMPHRIHPVDGGLFPDWCGVIEMQYFNKKKPNFIAK